MYIYKIVMTNGKEYVVNSDISTIADFAKRCTELNTICDFVLAEEYTDNGIKYNSVLIRADHVSSVEYAIIIK